MNTPKFGRHGRGWKDDLMELIKTEGKLAARRHKAVSNGTQEKRETVLFAAFKQLRELGHGVQRAQEFGNRHVKVLLQHWEASGLSASTMQNRLSVLRTLAGWLGKPGMVRGIETYLKDPARGRRTTVAEHDHSWSAVGIDAKEVVAAIRAYDRHVGMQLDLMRAFMLRREEAVMFRPHRADHGSHIVVRDGTKGGRERLVMIDTAEQREVLDRAKNMVKTHNGHVGCPGFDLKQALRRFNYVVGEKFGINRAKLGVTSHGLRHEGLSDLYERLAGVPAPVRAAYREAATTADPLKIQYARQRVADVAGHARLSISSAYIGAVRRRGGGATPPISAADSYTWQRLYELRELGERRTPEQTREMEDLVGRMLRVVGGAES